MPRPAIDHCDFTVIDETEDWIVVNKPAPLQVHPSRPDGGPTLWHGLRELLRYELENGAGLSIINRLDRDTSGVVLVAKHKAAARMLHKAMMRREVQKEYRAIVWGWPDSDDFTIDQPLLRRGKVEPCSIYNLQQVHPDGATSQTKFRVLRRFQRQSSNGSFFSLIAATPLTGRMHQIRVHLAYAGWPVVGDKLYGPTPDWYLHQIQHGWTKAAADALLLPRHALHSCLLRITLEDKIFEWRAELPADMEAFLAGRFRLEDIEYGVILGFMKSFSCSPRRPFFWSALLSACIIAVPVGTAPAQGSKKLRSKSSGSSKPSAKTSTKSPGAATMFDQHLAANMKFLNVLSRYADTLASATSAATAALAATRIETITKDAITAGEELVKLGHPDASLEARLAKDSDLEMTSRNVAEQTRTAVKALAANAEVKAILTPAVENFQAALNRIQQSADDPQGPGSPARAAAPPPATTAGSLPAVPASADSPAETRASEAASVPPPPQ